MTKIEVVRGLVMPFFPMRPVQGRSLRTSKLVEELYAEIQEPEDWICQPKLAGHGAALAVVDNKVYVQNRHGGWYGHSVKNAMDFAKLPNRTCLDGGVYEGRFYPYECLAVGGNLFTFCTANEREVMAYQLMRLIKQPWIFGTPSKAWLLQRRANLPRFEGVVLKRMNSLYAVLSSPAQVSADWFKRTWV
jgi:hypothetical protein